MTRGRGAVYVALAAGWVVLAWLLLGTTVPGDLSETHVNVDAVFGRDLVARTERYERFLLVAWVMQTIVTLAAFAVYARFGARLARESAAGPLGTGMLLGMLGLAIVWLVRLPFSLSTLWWARRHGISSVGYLDAVTGDWIELAVTFVSICVALLVVMALARRFGSWWWIPATAVLTAIVATGVFVAPFVYPGLERPADAALTRRFERLEGLQGIDGVRLRVEKVSERTSQANAFAFGIGPSARVVLWDTLLDGRFDEREVDVVLAHELGHHSSDHIAKSIGWFAVFALPGAFVLMLVTRSRGGMGEPGAVPLALLVVVVWSLVTSPAQNAVSRRIEAEADWKALETTRDPAAARGLFRGFAVTSLGDPSPPGWAYALLANHPTLAQRVGMTDAWAARRAGVPGT